MSGLTDAEVEQITDLLDDAVYACCGRCASTEDAQPLHDLFAALLAARAEQIAQQIEAFAADCKVSAHETDWDRGGQSALAAAARIARGQ